MQRTTIYMYRHPTQLKKREKGTKLLEEARTKEIHDEGKWLYRVRSPPWARKKLYDSKERSSNQNNTVNIKYTHKQLKCFYTNADNLINKFTEFKARVESHKCMVIAMTEVKPKKH